MTTITVDGMHCNSCRLLVEEELQDLGAIGIRITLDREERRGTITFEHADPEGVIRAIEQLGSYTVLR